MVFILLCRQECLRYWSWLTRCPELGDAQPRSAAGTEKQDAGLKPGATEAKRERPKIGPKAKRPDQSRGVMSYAESVLQRQ